MISCTRCLAVASTYEIEDEVDMEEWEVGNISINVYDHVYCHDHEHHHHFQHHHDPHYYLQSHGDPGAKRRLQGVRPELLGMQTAEAHRQSEHCA